MLSLLQKHKRGNIVLALLIALLVASTALSMYVGLSRDKRNTKLSIERMQEKIAMNAYIVAAQTSLFDYLNTLEVPIVYAQYMSVNTDQAVIHRVAVTDPVIVDVHSVKETVGNQVDNILSGKDTYALLRQDKSATFAGYNYDIEIAFDIDPNKIEQEFRVSNLMENPEVEFWEDNDLYYKSADNYTVELKNIPIIIGVRYDTWEQHIRAVLTGLEFKREIFEIIHLEEYENIEPEDVFNNIITGVARGAISTNNAQLQIIESYRFRR